MNTQEFARRVSIVLEGCKLLEAETGARITADDVWGVLRGSWSQDEMNDTAALQIADAVEVVLGIRGFNG